MWFQSILLDIFKKKKSMLLESTYKEISIVTLLPSWSNYKEIFLVAAI